MINNHKFFNFFLISGSMFSALVIVRLFWGIMRFRPWWLRLPHFVVPVTLLFFLTLSGVIDFFAIYNREPGGLKDVAANPTASWIAAHTEPRAVFLNSVWFYHPANLAGRFIFSGYPYFTWSYGYDKEARETVVKSIYNAPDKRTACRFLTANGITHVELMDRHDEYFTTNWDLWKVQFTTAFRHEPDGVSIYEVAQNCPA